MQALKESVRRALISYRRFLSVRYRTSMCGDKTGIMLARDDISYDQFGRFFSVQGGALPYALRRFQEHVPHWALG